MMKKVRIMLLLFLHVLTDCCGGSLLFVDFPMALHVPVAPELFLTNITEEWLVARVSPRVGLEVAQLGEGLLAGLAFEGLQDNDVVSHQSVDMCRS